jgi:hypothetical protein
MSEQNMFPFGDETTVYDAIVRGETTRAFEEIITTDPLLCRLQPPTPVWEICGAGDRYEQMLVEFTATKTMRDARLADPLFEDTLFQLYEDSKAALDTKNTFEDYAFEDLVDPDEYAMHAAAWLVCMMPDPANAEQVFAEHENILTKARAGCSGETEKRVAAYKHVLDVVYGERYRAYSNSQNQNG